MGYEQWPALLPHGPLSVEPLARLPEGCLRCWNSAAFCAHCPQLSVPQLHHTPSSRSLAPPNSALPPVGPSRTRSPPL
eukprot:8948301-Alexandrium_andersonii.AAC.2